MFSLVLLSFSESLAIKCLFLNDEPCMVRPTIIDMNPNELRYYLFMISLNKCTGSCKVLSPKTCVPKELKDVNVKAFNRITKWHEAMTKHIPCNCKWKINSTTCNSKQKWNNKTCQCECKNYRKCEKYYSLNPSTCFCENSKYLKSVADTSVTKCDKIVIAMKNLSTKKTSIITTNATATALVKYHSKKVKVYFAYSFIINHNTVDSC